MLLLLGRMTFGTLFKKAVGVELQSDDPVRNLDSLRFLDCPQRTKQGRPLGNEPGSSNGSWDRETESYKSHPETLGTS
jgi:hypothetical protein